MKEATGEKTKIAALARMFSSTVLRELGKKQKSPLFLKLVESSGLLQELPADANISTCFDRAFSILKKKDNRHEYVYKSALAQKVLLGIHNLETASMLTEFRAYKSKADVVILNGTSSVYEIKSDRDTTNRLESQIESYSKIFDKINVIVGEKHVESIFSMIPDYVGVQVLSTRFQVSQKREAVSNIKNIDVSVIFYSLRRNEIQNILKFEGFNIPHLPNTKIHSYLKNLFNQLTPEQAHSGFVRELKKSRNPKPLKLFLLNMPDSLKAAAISIPFSSNERSNLQNILSLKVKDILHWV